ncbi:MAG: DegV family protein [Bacillota bacterium]|nr:DegV family protein [Bacillota bacterium]
MEKILIVSDSASDIPKEEVKKHGIVILPITISYGGKTYSEYDIVPQDYWRILENTDEIPTTSQVTLDAYIETFRKAQDNGYSHVLCILINAKGSGTYSTGCAAREIFYSECGNDMRIELLDSRTYSYIYGRIAVNCAKMRDRGDLFEDILNDARGKIESSRAFLAVFSLKHLRKSGRISGGAAFIGEALGLRPISDVYNGSVTVFDKVRSDHALIPRISAHVKKLIKSPEEQTIILLYSDVPEDELKKAEQLLIGDVGAMAVRRVPIGPSVTTNSGPKSIGVAFYG